MATWVPGRQVAATLKLVQSATEWKMHSAHPLVVGQTKWTATVASKDPAVAAISPSVEIVLMMEGLVVSAQSAQLR